MHINRLSTILVTFFTGLISLLASSQMAFAEGAEAYCTIRTPTSRLDCLWVDKSVRRRMTSQDISNFIDQAQISAYMTVKSRAGLERVFLLDPEANSFKRLRTVEKTSSISDIIKTKSDLFTEIETKLVKLSDDLDAQAAEAELVKYDPSIATDRSKLQQRELVQEVENYRRGDSNYIKKENQTVAEAGDTLVSAFTKSKHRITLGYQTVGTEGNFAKTSQARYSSVDNLAALLAYRLTLSNWIFQVEGEAYRASTTAKSTNAAPVYAVLDSSKNVYNFAIKTNYCINSGTTQFCPGLDVLHDQFPVLSFRRLTITSGSPVAATSTLEMQTATDITVVPNVMLNIPLYQNLSLNNRFGYLVGTAALYNSPNKVKANTGYIVASVLEWPMWDGMAMNFGVEYLSRKVTIEAAASGNRLEIENNDMSRLTTTFGLNWLL